METDKPLVRKESLLDSHVNTVPQLVLRWITHFITSEYVHDYRKVVVEHEQWGELVPQVEVVASPLEIEVNNVVDGESHEVSDFEFSQAESYTDNYKLTEQIEAIQQIPFYLIIVLMMFATGIVLMLHKKPKSQIKWARFNFFWQLTNLIGFIVVLAFAEDALNAVMKLDRIGDITFTYRLKAGYFVILLAVVCLFLHIRGTKKLLEADEIVE